MEANHPQKLSIVVKNRVSNSGVHSPKCEASLSGSTRQSELLNDERGGDLSTNIATKRQSPDARRYRFLYIFESPERVRPGGLIWVLRPARRNIFLEHTLRTHQANLLRIFGNHSTADSKCNSTFLFSDRKTFKSSKKSSIVVAGFGLQ